MVAHTLAAELFTTVPSLVLYECLSATFAPLRSRKELPPSRNSSPSDTPGSERVDPEPDANSEAGDSTGPALKGAFGNSLNHSRNAAAELEEDATLHDRYVISTAEIVAVQRADTGPELTDGLAAKTLDEAMDDEGKTRPDHVAYGHENLVPGADATAILDQARLLELTQQARHPGPAGGAVDDDATVHDRPLAQMLAQAQHEAITLDVSARDVTSIDAGTIDAGTIDAGTIDTKADQLQVPASTAPQAPSNLDQEEASLAGQVHNRALQATFQAPGSAAGSRPFGPPETMAHAITLDDRLDSEMGLILDPRFVTGPQDAAGPEAGADQGSAYPSAPPEWTSGPSPWARLSSEFAALHQTPWRAHKGLLIGLGGAALVIVTLGIAIVTSLLGDASTQESAPSPIAQRATEFLAAGRSDDAIAVLEADNVAAALARDDDALFVLGQAYAAVERTGEALDAFRSAAILNPELGRSQSLLGTLDAAFESRDAKNIESAIALVRTVLETPAVRGDREHPVRIWIIGAASRHPYYGGRRQAMKLALDLGLEAQVDRLSSYTLDLQQGKRCKDRRVAVNRLRQLGNPAAIPALRQAIGNRDKESSAQTNNDCLVRTAQKVVEYLETLSPPAPADIPGTAAPTP